MADKQDYEVGYGRPPKATRFQRGRSGNPHGRPRKKPETFGTLFEEELRSTLVYFEGNVRKRSSKAGAIAKQLVNKAAGGDYRSIALLLKLAEALDPKGTKIKVFRPQTEEERLEQESAHNYLMEKLLRYSEDYQQEQKETAANGEQAVGKDDL